jgi:excinuclease ABC subunit A
MSYHELVIEGARQNNLKGISLRLPHDKVIVITGLSGSGKSSLAFDTIFAEGQWRFIESLSTYARLFLEKMDRPLVDAMDNIRPAIALEQRNPVKGARSTVGTLTELYDYLRLLYAKAAVPFCPRCHLQIRRWQPTDVLRYLLREHGGQRAFVVFPTGLSLQELRREGFLRLLLADGRVVGLEEAPSEGPYRVVFDRLQIREQPRVADSLEGAMRWGRGRLEVLVVGGPSLVFSQALECDRCGYQAEEPTPLLFSFNHPVGACPECKGFGNVLNYAEDLVVPDPWLSLQEGAIEPWQKPAYRWWHRQALRGAKEVGIDVRRPWRELPQEHRRMLFEGSEHFYGVRDFFEELEGRRYKLHVRVFLSRYRKAVQCPSCRGARLKPQALIWRLGGLDIAQAAGLSLGELEGFLQGLELSPEQAQVLQEPLRQMGLKLRFLQRVGLHYLSLAREARTLSGGEYQRVNLSNQLGSHLTGTLYVLDEPTVGLHPRDTQRIASVMRELSELGNTLVVVEHDRDIIRSAHWVVELGPGGGHLGGRVVFSGPMEAFLRAKTLTAQYVQGRRRPAVPRRHPRPPQRWLELSGARGNNLKAVRFRLPLGCFTVVTGVSGSGKSTLVVQTLYPALRRALGFGPAHALPYDTLRGAEALKGAKLIDQSPIGRTPRSNPVTYLKVFDHIRRLFASRPEARAHGWGPGFFSFNVPGGRCNTCKGEGYQRFEMYFFEDLYVKCEDCQGRRYGSQALSVKYEGLDIAQVLSLTVDEALELFAQEAQVRQRLQVMKDIGLGYLRLGQPATTLSGGEAQRLKICAELGLAQRPGLLYVLDEPTVGLHPQDVEALLRVLRELVRRGNTVLVIEHNLDVVAAADWVVDLGPEGGAQGGRVVFEGTPEQLRKAEQSYTGRYLRRYLMSQEA